jgi:hypothetical protein
MSAPVEGWEHFQIHYLPPGGRFPTGIEIGVGEGGLLRVPHAVLRLERFADSGSAEVGIGMPLELLDRVIASLTRLRHQLRAESARP